MNFLHKTALNDYRCHRACWLFYLLATSAQGSLKRNLNNQDHRTSADTEATRVLTGICIAYCNTLLHWLGRNWLYSLPSRLSSGVWGKNDDFTAEILPSLICLLHVGGWFQRLFQRISRLDGIITDCVELSIPRLIEGNMFQKRRVSSPAPVTIFWPHGLIER